MFTLLCFDCRWIFVFVCISSYPFYVPIITVVFKPITALCFSVLLTNHNKKHEQAVFFQKLIIFERNNARLEIIL